MHDIWTSVFIPLEVEDTFVEVVMSEAPVDARCRGAHLKKLCRAEGGANFFFGISCEKSRFYDKKIIFFPILGGACPPLDPPLLPMIWGTYMKLVTKYQISAINSC